MAVALFLIKWTTGREILSVFSDKIIKFLEFSYVGARFVYGDVLIDLGIFIFKVFLYFICSSQRKTIKNSN